MVAATMPTGPVAPERPAAGVSFPRLLKAEWIKLRSLRSTWWVVLLCVFLGVGFTMLTRPVAAFDPDVLEFPDGEIVDVWPDWAARIAVPGVVLIGLLLMVVLGARSVTGEYSSGSIRSTLAAAPRRGAVVAAKTVVVGAFATVASSVTVAGTLLVAHAMLRSAGYTGGFGGESFRMVAGLVIFVVTAALMALGLGFALRSTAAAVSASLGIYLVLPVLLSIPGDNHLMLHLQELSPGGGGVLLYTPTDEAVFWPGFDPYITGFWGAFAVVAGWAAVLIGVGLFVFKRRDA
ncbi:MAG: ABC transporter permease [Bifidobacteriaceae bacterium]|jgi:ABC-2 type transport system permease protein|nr:ABC transporter permease [Bifidobacteriaceae bacterium]